MFQVAFDVMNYQASSTEEESLDLASQAIPSAAALGINALDFNYIGMEDIGTCKVQYNAVVFGKLRTYFSLAGNHPYVH